MRRNRLGPTLFTLLLAMPVCAPAEPPPEVFVQRIVPAVGRPQGGELVTVEGGLFATPIRVFFKAGTRVREAFIASVTSNRLQIITPAFDLGTGQTAQADVQVVAGAGTVNEYSITLPGAFQFVNQVLTPAIDIVSPNTGPLGGGTRVWIIGDAFQAPVRVFFGTAEAQVLVVTLKQIAVIAPASSSFDPVPIRVVNINSDKEITLPNGFRYVAPMAVVAAGPLAGPASGGTRVRIAGVGFVDPVEVLIARVPATPIKVTPTEIVAITGAAALADCEERTGPIIVTNIDDGDTATAPQSFTYIACRHEPGGARTQ